MPENTPVARDDNGHFAKGASGNPGGRPKHTKLAITTLVEICRDKKAATNSRVAAANHILNRAYGTPPQSVNLRSDDLPVGIQIEFVSSNGAGGSSE